MRYFVLLMLVFTACGRPEQLRVREMAPVEYPLQARMNNLQGNVQVHLQIGPDGRVEWAEGGSGPEVLVKAAEESARKWVFGPFPPVAQFPIGHTVTFAFKLEGPPLSIVSEPTTQTHLPDRVDIIANPIGGDMVVSPKAPGPGTGQEDKPEDRKTQ